MASHETETTQGVKSIVERLTGDAASLPLAARVLITAIAAAGIGASLWGLLT